MTPLLTSMILREALAHGAYTVSFTKADGSERVMVCTTNREIISEVAGRDDSSSPSKETRARPETLIVAYDLQKFGWRSFHSDSVNSFEPFEE